MAVQQAADGRRITSREAVLRRADAPGYADLRLTGFEDRATRQLLEAAQFMRQGKVPSLRPLLPLLLSLKGQPYSLDDHFPFEPLFRTRIPKRVLMRTGRQVSKCLDTNSEVRTPGGVIAAGEVFPGVVVVSCGPDGRLRRNRVTAVWRTGRRDVVRLGTAAGGVRVTPEHRLAVVTGRGLEYLAAGDLRPGALLAARGGPRPLLETAADGSADTVDFEVERDANYLVGPDEIVSHNSTSLAARQLLRAAVLPHFATLFVTPLFEMTRRFSHNYVRKFLDDSPVKRLFTGKSALNNVLQRTFLNGSAIYFSYAFLDAERTRGVPADANDIDELGDMAYDHLAIIRETMSGSPWGVETLSGTPKSLDGTVARIWQDTSQAEWVTRCPHGGCGHWNVAALSHDLLDMIGPYHRDVSEADPGTVCAKCRKPISPRTGRWVHAYPERRYLDEGYHVPQVIMPMHYASAEKWGILAEKSQGRRGTTTTVFHNEVLGEDSDVGSKLVTVTELKAAANLPWPNRANEAVKHLRRYTHRVLAVDWGGGGGRISNSAAKAKQGDQQRTRTSYTTYAVLGMRPTGKVDVLWGHRSLRTHDWLHEAQLCVSALEKFKCSHLAHDFSGGGEGRLVLLYQAGLPAANVVNVRYLGAGRALMQYHPPTDDMPHGWYSVDKSRSLVTTCGALKHGLLNTFQYDYTSADEPGLLEDFLALIEEKVESRVGTDVYVIVRNPNKPDDFAQAVNMGCCTLWQLTKQWPDIAAAAKFALPEDILNQLQPMTPTAWDDY